MSQYASEAEFLDQSIPSDAWTGLTSPTIVAALVWASGVVDSYLRKRYTLPLTSVGEELKAAVCAIAAWNLLKRRGYRAGTSDDVVRMAYDDAIAWLKDISRGLAELDQTADQTAVNEGGPLSAPGDVVSWRFFTGTRTSDGSCE